MEEAGAADALEDAGAALSVCFFAAVFLRVAADFAAAVLLSLIHISEPTRPPVASRMPSSA